MALSDNLKGAALMTVSMAAFTVNDTFLKLLGGDLPLFQILLLRAIGVSILLAAYGVASGSLVIPASRRDRWLILWRSVAEAGAAWFFITALFHMPIANVSAILQALPLTVTLAAALFLGEPVGWRRFAAILIGFAGVYLIVRPGGEGFTIHSVYAVLSVLCVTLRDLAVRQLSPEVRSTTVAMATAVVVGLFAAAGSVFVEWRPMTGTHWAWLAGSVVMLLGAYLTSVSSMRVGEIGAVAPFRYTSLIVALITGWFVFGDWPDVLTLFGAAVIVGTGLFTLWREHVGRRRALAAEASRPAA